MAASLTPCFKRCLWTNIVAPNFLSCTNQMNLSTLLRRHQRELLLATSMCYVPTNRYSTMSPERAAADDHAQHEDSERLFSEMTLKVRSSDEAVLDSYSQFVQRAANILNLDISGKIVLPKHIEKRTLLKSPHIYKKHRAQYELRTHARMFQVRKITGETTDIFLEYIQRNIPEGVSMSVEQTELEYLPEYLRRPEESET